MARSVVPVRVKCARHVGSSWPVSGSSMASAPVNGSPFTVVKSPPMRSLPFGATPSSHTRPLMVGRKVSIQLPVARSKAAR